MKTNMGPADRAIRIILAVIIAVLYFTNVIAGTLGFILLILAIIFLLTSLVSFCPLFFNIRKFPHQGSSVFLW